MAEGTADREYMQRALALARHGVGAVSPNPPVGAVIVRQGEIIGEGYHAVFGGDHAEIAALRSISSTAAGATLYVTLEPCSHYGKTPPCADAIIQAGFREVIIGALDPNPIVSGRGCAKLRDAGIFVRSSPLTDECSERIEAFAKHILTGRPFVTLKLAQSSDGFIAPGGGAPYWLTSETSRKRVHAQRASQDAIAVGVGTALADNPALTVRLAPGRQPYRIVFDSHLRTPESCQLLKDEWRELTILLTTLTADNEKFTRIEQLGPTVITVPCDASNRIDVQKALELLGNRGITSLYLEGGATLADTFLKANLVDKLILFTAPAIVSRGLPTFMGRSTDILERLTHVHRESLEGDTLIEGYLQPPYRSVNI